jgi:hypothetical protein
MSQIGHSRKCGRCERNRQCQRLLLCLCIIVHILLNENGLVFSFEIKLKRNFFFKSHPDVPLRENPKFFNLPPWPYEVSILSFNLISGYLTPCSCSNHISLWLLIRWSTFFPPQDLHICCFLWMESSPNLHSCPPSVCLVKFWSSWRNCSLLACSDHLRFSFKDFITVVNECGNA